MISGETAAPAIEQQPAPPRKGPFEGLFKLMLRDTNIVVASVIANNLLRAISSMILTRLLVPEVFGISGVIASVQFTITLVTDVGFQAFIVRHKEGDNPRFLDAVWTIAVVRSLFLAAVLAASSGALAHLLGKPELTPLIAVSSLTFVIDATTSLSLICALRRRLILRLSSVEIIAQVTQIIVSSAAAWEWRNYWAILCGILASGVVKSVLSYAMFPDSVRRLHVDMKIVRELSSFARYITGSSIIFMLISQCDKLAFARIMPLDHFGFYVLAGNLAGAPLAFATAFADRVLFPAYAQLFHQDHPDLRREYYARRRLPSLLYSFAVGGIIGSAWLIVGLLYDHRYATAALYLQILSISTLFSLASSAANETLTATGRVSATFQASVAKMIWLLLAGTSGYFLYGQIGLVVAVGLMELPAMGFKWVRMHHAGLLDLKQELLFVAVGPVGILLGLAATRLAELVLGRSF
ncbi:oligosaccharide flippase family protein [Novosphingobium sp. BL-8A]|uniref:oligosaccharide flippase family protein n=1 Tax=Novosphingobium sp. BL-8A TaxID=3127639 RepID=UPI0037565805